MGSSMEHMDTQAMTVGRVGSIRWAISFRIWWFSSMSSLVGVIMVISLDRPQTTMEAWL